MEKSETIMKLAGALAAFQGEVENVKKDSTNPFFKSKYASLENVISTVKPLLAKNGLSYSQLPSGENELSTMLMHSSGEWIGATAKMTPKDSSPQAQGSAMTYMRRYALSALLGLATEDDDDGNEASKPKKQTSIQPRKVEPEFEGEFEEAAQKQVDAAYSDMDMSVPDQKKRIVELVKKLEPKTDTKSKKAIEAVVAEKTQLALEPANYPSIINGLTMIYEGTH